MENTDESVCGHVCIFTVFDANQHYEFVDSNYGRVSHWIVPELSYHTEFVKSLVLCFFSLFCRRCFYGNAGRPV